MAYQKQNFTNGKTLTAEQLTHIEDGIVALEQTVENIPDSGYATEQFVRDGYQPKGDYLESTKLPSIIDNALEQAMESGEFNGKDGGVISYTISEATDFDTVVTAGSYNILNGAIEGSTNYPSTVGGVLTVKSVPGKDYPVVQELHNVRKQFFIRYKTSSGWQNWESHALESWVSEGYQPKGNYLTEVPSGYATEEFVRNKIAEAELGGKEVDLSGYATKSEIPTKVSQLQEDATHRTVTDAEKTAWNDKGDVKTVNGATPDEQGNIELTIGDTSITRIESLDESNLVNLRDLETGSYVMYGYFIPYPGSSNILTFDNLLVNVVRKTAGTHVLVFSTLNSVVDFLEILVDETAENGFTYTRTGLNLLEMNALLQSVASAVRVAEIELLAANWVGDTSPYSQVVEIDGITEYSQVDLTPSVEQLSIFHGKDLAFVAENEDGVVTVYAIGQKPTNDYTIQATVTEVSV